MKLRTSRQIKRTWERDIKKRELSSLLKYALIIGLEYLLDGPELRASNKQRGIEVISYCKNWSVRLSVLTWFGEKEVEMKKAGKDTVMVKIITYSGWFFEDLLFLR